MRLNLDMSQQAKIETPLQFGRKEKSEKIGSCKNLPSNTVPPYGEVTPLWTAMTKRHQVCEEIESMGGKKLQFLQMGGWPKGCSMFCL